MPSYRLYRSRRDRMLAGVAGGLAEMWGADPSLVRIIWALLVVFTGGIALLVYIVMAIVVPDEDEVFGPGGAAAAMPATGGGPPSRAGGAAWPPRPGPRGERGGGPSAGVILGGVLVLLGVFFLVREYFPRIDFDWFWPLVLVALGIVLIASAMGRGPRADTPPPPPAAPPPAEPPSSDPS